ncbi:MAG: hypothetical protein ACYCYF_04555 [Anaerolineae bacterium]
MAEHAILTGARAALATHTRVLRLRELPCPGEVLVELGDQLEPTDVVARCVLEEQIVTLDLARALRMGMESVSHCLLVEPGQAVEPDTPVAVRHRNLGPSIHINAGVRGTVIGMQEGSLFVRSTSDWVQLRAYLPGEVCEIVPRRGVVIQATGSVLRGIWGAGREATGLLSVLAATPEAPLAWSLITERHYGMVLAAGTLTSALALRRAARYGVAGIIVGSLHPELRQVCREAPFPVVVTEGMGRIPMASLAFDLLLEHDGNRVALAGDSRLTASGPELIIPERLALETSALAVHLEPTVGALVRLTGLAHLGAVAEIVSLPSEPQVLGTGESVQGAWVRLADRRLVFVPLDNMELMAASAPDPLALLE